jgi:hypothetical protein
MPVRKVPKLPQYEAVSGASLRLGGTKCSARRRCRSGSAISDRHFSNAEALILHPKVQTTGFQSVSFQHQVLS